MSGTEVVITKGARPVAKLVAIAEKPTRQFGSAKGLIHIAEDLDEPLEDFRELRSTSPGGAAVCSRRLSGV